MRQFFIKKEITAIVFVLSLMIFSIINVLYFFSTIKDSVKKELSVGVLDKTINESLYQKTTFIESYGYIQSVLGKREFNNFEVMKDSKDMLYLSSSHTMPRDVTNIIERVKKLNEVVKNNGGNLVTLLPPDRFIEGKSEPLEGYQYSYNKETADYYLKGLKKEGQDILDYGKIFKENDSPIEDVFYKTDHHWKIETAFQANNELIDYLNKKDGLNLDPDHYFRNINHYNQIVYKDSYIGSLGRKTGIIYGGVEDFTLIYPKFETSFIYDMNHYGQKTHREGRMDDTLINPSYFKKNRIDYLSSQYDFYASYLDYNCSYGKIVNKKNPKGLKVAFYKDSYALPLIAFFSNVCSEIEIIDPRYYDGNIDQYFAENKFDYVFIAISPDMINDSSFIFNKK